ncbi:MAG: QacE family quaternary ammonium compound efflux SMR transporter [Candidatus Methanoplasma sp.]|jgi:quaternary ammonium compound-resistance protein SugE|nr:QacE family quaternary ammonium compound efflux SMR transporter [Candidatus Methanoplasma sp.]
MNAWSWVLIGGVFEAAWAATMKVSDGFRDLPWAAATLVLLACSILSLNAGLRKGLPVGGGYAVWVGVGAIGSIVMGVLFFEEALGSLKILFIAMILAGIIGTEMTCSTDG